MNLFEQQELKGVQYMTPEWAAELLVERYFPELSPRDLVVEPSAGRGSFLKAIPADVPAIGVEIDPHLAEIATAATGRRVIIGDFASVPLPEGVTAVIGNPPFQLDTIERFMMRSEQILPDCAKMGFLLPAYTFQTHSNVMRWLDTWSMKADMIPRTLFPGLSMPIVFATFTKDRKRGMVGFALYVESDSLDKMSKEVRAILRESKHKSAWRGVVELQLERMGGQAHLNELYRAIEHKRPTGTVWWKEQVRKVLQQYFIPLGEGQWAMPN